MATTQWQITGIPAFNDNYLWLIDDGQRAVIVDPGDAERVMKILREKQLRLANILITHHHRDHIGGVDQLMASDLLTEDFSVIGPDCKNIPQVNHHKNDGDTFELLGRQVTTIATPGHTLSHLCYFVEEDDSNPANAFVGDTLFAGGCGRVFEGTFSQMRESLEKLRQLPERTEIYCAHEYTLANLRFAAAVEPNSKILKSRLSDVTTKREAGIPTVPTLLSTELATNPFLRWDADEVIQTAQLRENLNQTDSLSQDRVFGAIRAWKDNF